GRNRFGITLRFRQRLANRAGHRIPDVLGLVFHPAVFRVVLFDLLLSRAKHGESCGIINHGSRTGGALVDGENDGRGHGVARAGGHQSSRHTPCSVASLRHTAWACYSPATARHSIIGRRREAPSNPETPMPDPTRTDGAHSGPEPAPDAVTHAHDLGI